MRERYAECWDGWLPDREDFGTRYPWTTVRRHALSAGFRRRIDQALEVLDDASRVPGTWAACLSGGKDSTAVALLLHRLGWSPTAMSLRDGLCWRGENRYLDALAARTGLPLRRVVLAENLLDLATQTPGAIRADHESRTGTLSGPWFRALDDDDKEHNIGGKVWGLRAEESDTRRWVRRRKGALYQRADGMWIAAPLADWSAIDVHALLAHEDVPPHPVYLCLDPGSDPMAMRHSWWLPSESAARYGHYSWLRRWWPNLWETAVSIDPSVATLG